MSTDADTLIRSGVAQGLRLETIIDAAREQLAVAPGAPRVRYASNRSVWSFVRTSHVVTPSQVSSTPSTVRVGAALSELLQASSDANRSRTITES